MKIEKINNKVNLPQNEVSLQGCMDDCPVFYLNTHDHYIILHNAGLDPDGTETPEEILEIFDIFGFYCYRTYNYDISPFF